MVFPLKYKTRRISTRFLIKSFHCFQSNVNPNAPPPMPMNVNEGIHNPGVPFFPVRKSYYASFENDVRLFL